MSKFTHNFMMCLHTLTHRPFASLLSHLMREREGGGQGHCQDVQLRVKLNITNAHLTFSLAFQSSQGVAQPLSESLVLPLSAGGFLLILRHCLPHQLKDFMHRHCEQLGHSSVESVDF